MNVRSLIFLQKVGLDNMPSFAKVAKSAIVTLLTEATIRDEDEVVSRVYIGYHPNLLIFSTEEELRASREPLSLIVEIDTGYNTPRIEVYGLREEESNHSFSIPLTGRDGQGYFCPGNHHQASDQALEWINEHHPPRYFAQVMNSLDTKIRSDYSKVIELLANMAICSAARYQFNLIYDSLIYTHELYKWLYAERKETEFASSMGWACRLASYFMNYSAPPYAAGEQCTA